MRLHRNVGTTDRVVRIIAGLALAVALVAGTISGPLTAVVGLVAAVLVVTGAIGFCPLYALFRISTRPANG
jgi:hypothetical protein